MMHQVYRTLPDDRPITSLQIVEDPEKCPSGFVVVSRTHDQDSDADLWREGRVFGKKATRYICLSKSEGLQDYIVESIVIMNERDLPPEGYSVLTRTADTDARAWRKRQLCYRLTRINHAKTAITDIIVLSRMKKSPEGFALAGEINGMTICFKTKMGLDQAIPKSHQPVVPYSIMPPSGINSVNQNMLTKWYTPPPCPKLPSISKPTLNGVQQFSVTQPTSGDTSPHEYERLINVRPSRPAPKPPRTFEGSSNNYATISAHHGLEGVPFVLNVGFEKDACNLLQIPVIKAKSKHQLDEEFGYAFQIERQT